MSDKNVSVNVGGVFVPLLTVLFIGLKLTGYINWSWWWVLAPVWISVSVAVVILAIILAIALVIKK